MAKFDTKSLIFFSFDLLIIVLVILLLFVVKTDVIIAKRVRFSSFLFFGFWIGLHILFFAGPLYAIPSLILWLFAVYKILSDQISNHNNIIDGIWFILNIIVTMCALLGNFFLEGDIILLTTQKKTSSRVIPETQEEAKIDEPRTGQSLLDPPDHLESPASSSSVHSSVF